MLPGIYVLPPVPGGLEPKNEKAALQPESRLHPEPLQAPGQKTDDFRLESIRLFVIIRTISTRITATTGC